MIYIFKPSIFITLAVLFLCCNKEKNPSIPSKLALFYEAKDSMLIKCDPLDNSSPFSIEFTVNEQDYCSPRFGEKKSIARLEDLYSFTTTSPTLEVQFDSTQRGERRLFHVAWDDGYRQHYTYREEKDRWIPFARFQSGRYPTNSSRLDIIRSEFSSKDTLNLASDGNQLKDSTSFFQLYCHFCTQVAYDRFPESEHGYSHVNLSPYFCIDQNKNYMLINQYKETMISLDSIQIEVELSFEFDLCAHIHNAENPYFGRVTDGKIRMKFIEML